MWILPCWYTATFSCVLQFRRWLNCCKQNIWNFLFPAIITKEEKRNMLLSFPLVRSWVGINLKSKMYVLNRDSQWYENHFYWTVFHIKSMIQGSQHFSTTFPAFSPILPWGILKIPWEMSLLNIIFYIFYVLHNMYVVGDIVIKGISSWTRQIPNISPDFFPFFLFPFFLFKLNPWIFPVWKK